MIVSNELEKAKEEVCKQVREHNGIYSPAQLIETLSTTEDLPKSTVRRAISELVSRDKLQLTRGWRLSLGGES